MGSVRWLQFLLSVLFGFGSTTAHLALVLAWLVETNIILLSEDTLELAEADHCLIFLIFLFFVEIVELLNGEIGAEVFAATVMLAIVALHYRKTFDVVFDALLAFSADFVVRRLTGTLVANLAVARAGALFQSHPDN